MFSTPDPFLVNRYLEEIAKTYNVNWKADDIDLISVNFIISKFNLLTTTNFTNYILFERRIRRQIHKLRIIN
jgi:hypothetical protein